MRFFLLLLSNSGPRKKLWERYFSPKKRNPKQSHHMKTEIISKYVKNTVGFFFLNLIFTLGYEFGRIG